MKLSNRNLPMRKWLIILGLTQVLVTALVINGAKVQASQKATPEVLESIERTNGLMNKKIEFMQEYIRIKIQEKPKYTIAQNGDIYGL